ncbi:unnamed protein product [Periconia digitata]|uniref:Rhodopsin domain-containing protein n=1 Tax=Periconia digitata TaxID=1303443 RepID=A0A9W4US63_9PLEO|nr:unnamed protein product [Periconia digitata]
MASFVTEMWTWYAVTLMLVGARFLSRRLFFHSFKAFQSDDWLMLFVISVYTSMLIVIHIQTFTPTNLLNPADNIVLTPEDIKLREYGSKLVLVTEHLQMVVIWSLKGCLLILYSRMTMSLRHSIMVKVVAGYTVGSFVVMEILWFIWCRPFSDYWKVPAPSLNCSAETNHMITNAVFNISTDIMIICLPMPILISSQLPLRRKLTLCSIFALGSFTILAAILSKYYSLGSPYGTDWIYWYIREVSTAIITANLPLTWTLLQRIFGTSSFFSRNKSSGARTGVTGDPARQSRFRSTYGNLTSATGTKVRKPKDPHPIDISPSESQEQIAGDQGIQMKIWQHSEVLVTSEEVECVRDGAASAADSDKDKESLHSPSASLDGDRIVRTVDMGVSTDISRAKLNT